jgi:polyhydroxyalkanoate synthesis regulator phasin
LEDQNNIEKRFKALEDALSAITGIQNKPKFKSFFDNNMDGVAEKKLAASLKNDVENLKRDVKLLKDELSRLKTELKELTK